MDELINLDINGVEWLLGEGRSIVEPNSSAWQESNVINTKVKEEKIKMKKEMR